MALAVLVYQLLIGYAILPTREATAQAEKQKLAEEMLITAFQNAVPLQAIEAMRQNAGITEDRLAELKEQAKRI